MSANVIAFIVVFVIAVILFMWSCYRRFSLIRLGRAENRSDNIGRRIGGAIVYPLAQLCTISRRYRFGINHAVLFWCFVVLLIANAEFILHGLAPDVIGLSRLSLGAHQVLALIFDLVSIFALLAIIIAVIRRIFLPPSYIEARSRDAFIILSLVGVLMLAFFGMHAAEISLGAEKAAGYMPVSGFVAGWFSSVPAEGLETAGLVLWWIHAVVLLAFLNYLPYSKHMHILTAFPNYFFRNLDRVNIPPREEFKQGNSFGVGRVDQFIWKGLLDSYSCTECGRCSDLCPATRTDKPLNPRLVIHEIKINLLKNGPLFDNGQKAAIPLIGSHGEGSVSEEAIWSCTTCGACTNICPVAIEQYPRIIDMRRNLVEMHSEFPQELLAFFENMEQRRNPWGIAPTDRTKWTADLDIKTFQADQTEYLFYVGCAGSFDSRSRRTTTAIARILDAAGISWGILGKDEICCGDSLRRLGNEFIFERIAEENVKLFKERDVRKVITQCPHCYNTLKRDYCQYGIELEVVHYAELFNQLLRDGRLKLNGANKDLGNVVFHDSCYLGRHNKVYEAPRRALSEAIGQHPTEMAMNYDNSFCCGAGGGRMWLEENIGKHINVERVEQAMQKNAQTICACCPYCVIMFEDGLKDLNADDKVQVLDLAEIIARALPE